MTDINGDFPFAMASTPREARVESLKNYIYEDYIPDIADNKVIYDMFVKAARRVASLCWENDIMNFDRLSTLYGSAEEMDAIFNEINQDADAFIIAQNNEGLLSSSIENYVQTIVFTRNLEYKDTCWYCKNWECTC